MESDPDGIDLSSTDEENTKTNRESSSNLEQGTENKIRALTIPKEVGCDANISNITEKSNQSLNPVSVSSQTRPTSTFFGKLRTFLSSFSKAKTQNNEPGGVETSNESQNYLKTNNIDNSVTVHDDHVSTSETKKSVNGENEDECISAIPTSLSISRTENDLKSLYAEISQNYSSDTLIEAVNASSKKNEQLTKESNVLSLSPTKPLIDTHNSISKTYESEGLDYLLPNDSHLNDASINDRALSELKSLNDILEAEYALNDNPDELRKEEGKTGGDDSDSNQAKILMMELLGNSTNGLEPSIKHNPKAHTSNNFMNNFGIEIMRAPLMGVVPSSRESNNENMRNFNNDLAMDLELGDGLYDHSPSAYDAQTNIDIKQTNHADFDDSGSCGDGLLGNESQEIVLEDSLNAEVEVEFQGRNRRKRPRGYSHSGKLDYIPSKRKAVTLGRATMEIVDEGR